VQSRWSDADARAATATFASAGADLALRVYTSRLLGADPALVLHGGGNTSLKGTHETVLGAAAPALFVKASGYDLATIAPAALVALDLEYLLRLRAVAKLSDAAMVNELRTHRFDHRAGTPSIETLVHAWIPARYVDHTHADAILALTNQVGGEALVREALGKDVIVLPYVKAGFALAKASATAFDAQPDARAMVLMKHGVITWGATARESYQRMIEVVSGAERFVAGRAKSPLRASVETSLEVAQARAARVAPLLRGLLASPSGDADRPHRRVVVRPLALRTVLDFVDDGRGHALSQTPTVTSDHLIRTKALPAWIDAPAWDDEAKLREQLAAAIGAYARDYDAYFERQRAALPEGALRADSKPRVVLLPGLGALCAGEDVRAADIAADITRQTLSVKAQIAAMGDYDGLPEEDLFAMEYYTLQQAKLSARGPALAREVAIVTGAAGAIGSGIVRGLLREGCHVAATDLADAPLDALVTELRVEYGKHITGVALDVADPASVAAGFAQVCATFGGVDLLVINAGLAHVATLGELELEAFRRVGRVNVEGTLLLLKEAARVFAMQRTGGDIVLVSTKNVFAPGAGFGAYSATKAASHQLARIASLELAAQDVRVNMVAPDAVFSDGARKSGLWQEVGPSRMKARGLDEKGLEEFYQNRNLLKARITADHVANAVLFFATRRTPTTGATLPVDGGLPDATPR
jgi:rhamnose utilization protein RhaD (predicted bifunctional aldolase and dehydrogenase)/NAD(P)-dependent dehydrogenase (short-subunit alcohol dehydrogenase family)